tara:strand:- start:1089 stop:1349 length:261 start_codon:yes stop_codon:yes gene_type:complete
LICRFIVSTKSAMKYLCHNGRDATHGWYEGNGQERGGAPRVAAWQYMSSMGQKTGMLKTEKKVRTNATQKALVSEYQNLNSGSLPW